MVFVFKAWIQIFSSRFFNFLSLASARAGLAARHKGRPKILIYPSISDEFFLQCMEFQEEEKSPIAFKASIHVFSLRFNDLYDLVFRAIFRRRSGRLRPAGSLEMHKKGW